MFGPRPLASAIEAGWPLKDGTALVARDGALARVRTSDGALVENVGAAFPLNPARCHPLPLSFDGAVAPRGYEVGALGFVCGEPRGRTRPTLRDVAPNRGMVEQVVDVDYNHALRCSRPFYLIYSFCGRSLNR